MDVVIDGVTYTDEDRERIRERYRGRSLGDCMYREFCHDCGIPLMVRFSQIATEVYCCECEPHSHGHVGKPNEPGPPTEEQDANWERKGVATWA